MTDASVAVSAFGGAILTVAAVLAIIWRFMLPWLRTQIVAPVQETRDHVANSHTTNMRDDFDALVATVDELTGAVGEVKTTGEQTSRAVARIGGQLDAHLTSAAASDAATNARLTALETRE